MADAPYTCEINGHDPARDLGAFPAGRVDHVLCVGAAAKLVRLCLADRAGVLVMGTAYAGHGFGEDRYGPADAFRVQHLDPNVLLRPRRGCGWARIEEAFRGLMTLIRVDPKFDDDWRYSLPASKRKKMSAEELADRRVEYWVRSRAATELLRGALGLRPWATSDLG